MSAAVLHVADSDFETNVINSDKPVFVDFFTTWCGPCKAIAPIVEELAKDYEGRAVVAKVNVEEANDVASRFGITSVPTIMVFKGGQPVEVHTGSAPKGHFVRMIEKHL